MHIVTCDIALFNILQTLNQLCTDPQVREVLTKIQNHIDVLEKSTARVSSRAEVLGAIQQVWWTSRKVVVETVCGIKEIKEKNRTEFI